MFSEQERVELEARVFSRAGADDPRTERIDPVTGRALLLTDSEWRLLEFDRRSADLDGASRTGRAVSPESTPRTEVSTGSRSMAHDGQSDRTARSAPAWRRGVALLVLVAGAAMVAAASVVAALVGAAGSGEGGDPAVEAIIAPRAPAAAGAIAGRAAADPHHHGAGTMAVFLDPNRTRGSLPGWLEEVIPSSRVAQLTSPTGPIAGVGTYAVTTPDLVACLIARIEAAQMVWSCATVRELATDGMVLRAAIPEGLGSGLDPDGDGISGDAARTDLLVVEWHADGTFRIAREPG